MMYFGADPPDDKSDDFDLSFKIYYDLMARRVSEILLVSSPYDAFIMEEDGRLAERIIYEYRGLNLTRPPRLTWVPNTDEAFRVLSEKKFDLVMTMPRQDDMNPYRFGREIKNRFGNIPVFLLTHSFHEIPESKYGVDKTGIDRWFVWTGNTDLLLALVKNIEDRMNVAYDTRRARVRVIIVVEDSPLYSSSFLPLLYRVIVTQTNAVMEESLNEEHRILRMRARPKFILTDNFEEAENYYRRFKPYLLSVFSDVRLPKGGKINKNAGFDLLSIIREESPDLPLLMLSSEEENREKARSIGAVFLNKNSLTLHNEIRSFFVRHLGFGDFIFRLPDGKIVGRAANLMELEKIVAEIPEESVLFHAGRNDFSAWLMARSEIQLASKIRPARVEDFSSTREIRDFIITSIRERRKGRQKGVVTDFSRENYDHETDFVKVGKGMLGGKARGLAFITSMMKSSKDLWNKYPEVEISVPKSFVISTDGFDALVAENNLKDAITCNCDDTFILDLFLRAHFPDELKGSLEFLLRNTTGPLAVRSSSLLEDAMFQARAGIYRTCMIPNNHPDINVRLQRLIDAIKLVYASTYQKTSVVFSRSTRQRTEEEKMAIIIQKVTGSLHGKYYYPAISGVAQSYNYYPLGHLSPEDGIVHMALGLGKTVVEGGLALRFSPAYPEFLPQFATVDDTLRNSQHRFYALNMDNAFQMSGPPEEEKTLSFIDINDEEVINHHPIRMLCGTYSPNDHVIRDSAARPGHRVLTFASILKYKTFPLPEIIMDILEMGKRGMGCPVEIEFAVNLPQGRRKKTKFDLLQIRPMAMGVSQLEIEIRPSDVEKGFCFSTNTMGNGLLENITDIVYVDPEVFEPAKTPDIAAEIGKINTGLVEKGRKYLLIGPGRWGSADKWLGIPVSWKEISGVGAMVELAYGTFRSDPSQGTHFFNNITSLGIGYFTISESGKDFFKWEALKHYPIETKTDFVKHIHLNHPLTIKIDGKQSQAVIILNAG